jgi:hypothetical protein
MNARARNWTRIEALVLVLILIALAIVWAFRSGRSDIPALGRIPIPPPTVSSTPSRAPNVAPTKAPSAEQPGAIVPVRFEQPGGTSSHSRPGPQPTSTPQPSRSPKASQTGTWTNCHASDSGGLACSGSRASFTCVTAQSGDTTCRGKQISFSCSTDARTGARDCSSGSDSWHCMTNAATAATSCAGTTGSYSCRAGTGADETCRGSQDFSCYDQPNGRNCGSSNPNEPDCYFEPIFGAYCRM